MGTKGIGLASKYHIYHSLADEAETLRNCTFPPFFAFVMFISANFARNKAVRSSDHLVSNQNLFDHKTKQMFCLSMWFSETISSI